MDAWPNVDQRQLGCVEHVQWCDALIHPVVRLEERTAALSLVVMPVLVKLKRRVVTRLDSSTPEADAWQTWMCAYVSAILLAGIGLNLWLRWW
jgi:hypothetical protein